MMACAGLRGLARARAVSTPFAERARSCLIFGGSRDGAPSGRAEPKRAQEAHRRPSPQPETQSGIHWDDGRAPRTSGARPRCCEALCDATEATTETLVPGGQLRAVVVQCRHREPRLPPDERETLFICKPFCTHSILENATPRKEASARAHTRNVIGQRKRGQPEVLSGLFPPRPRQSRTRESRSCRALRPRVKSPPSDDVRRFGSRPVRTLPPPGRRGPRRKYPSPLGS